MTLVFCHGYALNLDCWHFQREHYRGRVRAVYYDQRSHGRSGRSPLGNATIDQLGARPARTVLDAVAPDGPVVLVGHSMGGMTIVALAEQHPELLGDRVVGAALVSTTAGGLDPSRILFPMVPGWGVSGALHRGVADARPRTPRRRRAAPDRPQRRAGRHRPARVRRRRARELRRVRRRDARRRRRSRWSRSSSPASASLDKFDHVGVLAKVPTIDHLRHRRQAHLDRPQPQAAPPDRRLRAAGVPRRRAHGDPRAATTRSTASSTGCWARRGPTRVTRRGPARRPGVGRAGAGRRARGLRGPPAARPAGRRAHRDRGVDRRQARRRRRPARLPRRRSRWARWCSTRSAARRTCAASASPRTPRATASRRR